MKSYLPILSLLIVFASCTSAYKSGQTPDDVYFSPERPQDEYVQVNNNDDRRYMSDEEYRDDRYLRMKVRNRRWSTLEDSYAYGYNYYPSLSYGYNYWNAVPLWNYYYNPYCYYNNVIISNPKSPVYNKPRTFNLHVFSNTTVPTTNPKTYRPAASSSNNRSDNYRSSGSSAGNYLRDIFGGSSGNSSSGSSGSANSKTSSSGSSSSGSSSSGSSSSGSSRGNATRGRN